MAQPQWKIGVLLAVALGLGSAAVAVGGPSIVQDQKDQDAAEETASVKGLVVVKAGRILTMAGEDIEDGVIVIRDGKIEAVGSSVDYPYGGRVIDASKQTVMPGLINPCSRAVGVQGGNGVAPQTTLERDVFVTGEDLEDVLAAGYTTLGIVPRGATLPGRILVVRTVGEATKDAIIEAAGPVYITMNNPGSDKANLDRAIQTALSEKAKLKKAREDWEKKQKAAKEAPKPAPQPAPQPNPTPAPTPTPTPQPKATGFDEPPPADKKDDKKDDSFKPPPLNPAAEPIIDLLDKKPGATAQVEFGLNVPQSWGVTITAAGCYAALESVLEKNDFPHSYRIFNPVVDKNSPFAVTPETDVAAIVDRIGKRKAAIALWPVINHHAYTRDQYSLGLLLHRAGAKVVYLPEREDAVDYLRMRDALAIMVRYGYPRAEVLKTVTIHAAEMLGVESRVGSIEKGKDANLVFLDGDPLTFSTAVVSVMVEGKVQTIKKRIR